MKNKKQLFILDKRKQLLLLSTILSLTAGATAYKYFNSDNKADTEKYIDVTTVIAAIGSDAILPEGENKSDINSFYFENDVYLPVSSLENLSFDAIVQESVDLKYTGISSENYFPAMYEAPRETVLLIQGTKEITFEKINCESEALLIDNEWFVPFSAIQKVTNLQIEYFTNGTDFSEAKKNDDDVVRVIKRVTNMNEIVPNNK